MSKRKRRKSITEADLYINGLAVRLAVLTELTGRSRHALIADIERGNLKAFQYFPRPGSAWYVERADARAWLAWVRQRQTAC